ncbi:CRISPR-associated RAMP protein, Cmr1 family [Thermocrinis albus DSM 14484]|uniref:CRISPR-associated RAMP protein, Cmr1 family n=1 Tax=Thermocrinis albus (strain DSM 14484 / JCM 11386 / HI 11/12) TaxID=638303 RepID=D3SNA7_THEAH|nr:type III-B CRISPR module RAMP protein Cmr1 [Thermocrinis albus]ADC88644.1 CRISPR-associated RAMP protein, Cmr1 family [Thermocrinis albus DSM 14484]
MEKLTSLEYTLEFVTPAFIGGADPEKAELRPASIVGMLRWWFRVLVGAFVESIEELFQLESELFGNQDKAGKIWVRVLEYPAPKSIETKTKDKDYNYLLGLSKRGKGFDKGEKVKLRILTPDNLKELTEFLVRFAFTFGNLGNRARKGFGSLDFSQGDLLIDPTKDLSIEKLKEILRPLMKEEDLTFHKNSKYPNISNMKVFKKSYRNLDSELSYLSEQYRNFRAPSGLTEEYKKVISLFMDRKPISDRDVVSVFKNHMFGLPIMFFSRKRNAKVMLSWTSEGQNGRKVGDRRRAAPFWISFKREKIYITLFRSSFLPEGSKIVLQPKGRHGNKKQFEETFPEDYDYLERFFKKIGFEEVFDGGSLK